MNFISGKKFLIEKNYKMNYILETKFYNLPFQKKALELSRIIQLVQSILNNSYLMFYLFIKFNLLNPKKNLIFIIF